MSKKRIFLLIALLVAALVFVTACNNDDDDETPATSNEPEVTQEADPVTSNEPDDEPAQEVVHTDPPRPFRIASFYLHQMLGAAPAEAPDPDTASDYEMARMQYDNMREVERRFNIEIEWVNTMSYDEHLETFLLHQMAGDPIGEVVLLSGRQTLIAMQGGHLVDIATLQFPGSDLHGARNTINASVEVENSIWQVNANTGGDPWRTLGLIVNNDLINRLGLPNPVELYESGNWTWDVLLDIMRTAKAQGYYGMGGTVNDLGNVLFASNDATMMTSDYIYAFDQPNQLEAVEFFFTMMDERLWNYVLPTDQDNWGRSYSSFFEGDTVFSTQHMWGWGMIGGTELSFSALPFPAGPSNVSGNSWQIGFDQGLVIPNGVYDPLEVLQIVEALLGWAGDELWLMRIGGLTSARNEFQTEEDAQRWMHISGNMRGNDLARDLEEFTWVWNTFADDFLNGYRTVAEAIEVHRGPNQEIIDNFFR